MLSAPRVRAAFLAAVALVFVAVWYAKAFAFEGYPGHVQESVAAALLGAGAPLPVLDFIFGRPEWSLWIALGAVLRLSVTWPRPLDTVSIAVSGVRDREGMLRSVALAGADIGAAFRRLAVSLRTHGLLEARAVWPAVILAGAVDALVPAGPAAWLMASLLASGCAVATTNLRASFVRATRRQRNRILWVVAAAVTAGSAFVVSATLSFTGDAVASIIGLAVASLAPFSVLAMLAVVVTRRPSAAGPWLRRTVFIGASGATGAIAYLLALVALPGAATPAVPVRELVALATSVVLVAVSQPRLRDITNRIAPPLAR
jgi:hypothetical protein